MSRPWNLIPANRMRTPAGSGWRTEEQI
jgi:hypothetical protein